MRQIAGGSQSGLKKFLAQYPSVFTVLDGDLVAPAVLTGADKNQKNRSDGKRDYEQEAVDYFRGKMVCWFLYPSLVLYVDDLILCLFCSCNMEKEQKCLFAAC